MAKELPYFQFYINDWLTGNVTLQDMATQGVFINICVLFWSRDCDLSYQNCIERFKKKDRKHIESLIKLGIILKENEKIRINFLENQLKSRKILSKNNKKNGEIGLNAQKKMALAIPNDGNIDKIREDKNREEEIRENNIKKKNLIEIFFQDLENSSQFEMVAQKNGITKDELKTFVEPFKIKAELSYPNFERFVSHFKNYVVNERMRVKTANGQKPISKIEKAITDREQAKELINKIHG